MHIYIYPIFISLYKYGESTRSAWHKNDDAFSS